MEDPQVSHNTLYPVIEWQSYPSSASPSKFVSSMMNKSMLDPDSADSSTLPEDDSNPRSAKSGTVPMISLRRTKASWGIHSGECSESSRYITPLSNAEEQGLEGFADQFRALVHRVSCELEESRNLESCAEPHTPPLHRVLDTHMPHMSIDEVRRKIPSEERITVLGSVVKWMPTIKSVGSAELSSPCSNTVVSGYGIGSPSCARSSSASSHPPTRERKSTVKPEQ
jgi:hypothetical protein